MEHDLNVEQAQQLILDNIHSLPSEMISIMEAAGRVVVEEIVSERNLPSELQSAVDGFALGDDRAAVNSCFTLIGSQQLDEPVQLSLSSGQAMGVMTGGILPRGTQSVVMHEKVQVNSNRITVLEEIEPGNNVKQIGEDYRQGETLLESGTRLDAGHISILAAFGHNEVSVYSRPRVALLGLGKNIVPVSQSPERGKVRDSNSPLLTAYTKEAGGLVTSCTLASQLEDDELINCLAQLKQQADVIILTGGTYSETDAEAQSFLESCGAKMIYWGTSIQPGSHNGLAMLDSVPVFALSGNPAACAVGFNLFVVPALRYMQGLNPALNTVQARCTNDFNKVARTRRLIRGNCQYTDQGWYITVLPGQKPSMLRSLINCNALIDMQPGHPPLEAGSYVDIILLNADNRFTSNTKP